MSSIQNGSSYNRPDGKRWYIQTFHDTGVPFDPMLCAWFYTREQARQHIRDMARMGPAF